MATPIPQNDALFTLNEVLAATGGRVSGPLADEAMQVRGVSTDTRRVRAGELLVAISGERFDGHDHLAAAATAGAALAIIERDVDVPVGLTTLRVTSTVAALGALARAHMRRWRRLAGARKVLAITGSAGKTTTKQAVGALLAEVSSPEKVCVAAGNLNNLIGVPMVVLGLTDAHHYAVLELGTNQPGEIGKLARIAAPDVGLLTLIASAHSEGLGSIEAIAAEKTALYREIAGAVAIGNADDDRVRTGMTASKARHRIGYGEAEDADYRVLERQMVSAAAWRVRVRRPDGSEIEAEIPLLGRVGALAFAAAVAATEALREGEPLVDSDTATRALARTQRSGRLHLQRAASGLLIIDDSYNSNPASCQASIDTAAEIARELDRELVLVLGEMRELGEQSVALHRDAGDDVVAARPTQLIAVCGDARAIHERAEAAGIRSNFVEDSAAAAALALDSVGADALVLVKGSRGVRTERVVGALMDAHGQAGATHEPDRCASRGGGVVRQERGI